MRQQKYVEKELDFSDISMINYPNSIQFWADWNPMNLSTPICLLKIAHSKRPIDLEKPLELHNNVHVCQQ